MGEEKKSRHFYLGESVSEASMKELIKNIREINRLDDEQERKVVNFVRKPIELIVSSYGGSVYDGFGLVDTMNLSKTPIHTICIGKAMSMGFIILLAGHKRFMTEMATAMYHQISTGTWAELEKIKRTVAECERLERMYDAYVLKRTNIMQDKLDLVKATCRDWYICAEDCKKLGIIDEILGAA